MSKFFKKNVLITNSQNRYNLSVRKEKLKFKETNYGKSIGKKLKNARRKVGIAKQSCVRSPHGTENDQAKSKAIFLVSNVKMTRISL